MSVDICQLCIQKSTIKHLSNKEIADIQQILQKGCDFLFQDENYTIDQICISCWKTVHQFHEYCRKIQVIHENFTYDDDKATVAIEYVEEETIDNFDDPLVVTNSSSSLRIEKDLDNNSSLARRQLPLTSSVIRGLEKQLKFEAVLIQFSDLDFDKVSRFIEMECSICREKFDSFNNAHEHYYDKHSRCAFWTCCKIDLDTPYDILDHIKYHESIEDFKCAACKKLFLTSNKLKYHICRNHLPDEPFICTVCDKDCKTQRTLITHQKNHISFDCPFCEKIVSAANYEQHVKHHTASNTKRPSTSNLKKQLDKKTKLVAAQARKIDSKKKIFNQRIAIESKSKVITKKGGKMKNKQTKKCTLSIEKNEDGMFECDICKMKFDQMSRVFIHRNKVHV